MKCLLWPHIYELEIPKYTISTSVNSTYAGVATASAPSAQNNEEVTFTATPNTGYKFSRWTDASGDVSTNATYKRTFSNAAIGSEYSIIANFSMDGTPTPSASNISANSMTVSWTKLNASSVDYKLYVSTNSGCSGSYISGYGPLSTKNTSANLTGLSPNKTYYFRVEASSPDEMFINKSSIINATTAKGDSSVTTAPKANTLTYTGEAQQLVTAGVASNGTMQYSLDKTNYSANIPTETDAKTYTVWYKVKGNADYNDTTPVSVSVTINKANSSVTAAPTAITGLVYNESAQALINAGTASGGTMQYSVNGGEYSATIPQAIQAGDYTVSYKVVGDSNHNDNIPTSNSFTVSIAKKDRAESSVLMNSYVYDQTESLPAPELDETPEESTGTSVTYYYNTEASNTGGTPWTNVTSATSLAAGTYYMYATLGESSNYNSYTTETTEFVIDKAASSVTPPQIVTDIVYDGEPHALITAGLATGGTIKYNVNGGAYTEDIPTGTDAGDYFVNYMVDGDDNHSDTPPQTEPLEITIDKALRDEIHTLAESYIYGQSEALFVPTLDAVPEEDAEVSFYYNDTNSKVGGTKWESMTSVTLDAGTYYMYAEIASTANYYSYTTDPVEFVVNKGECVITAPSAQSLAYTSSAQELINAGSAEGGKVVYSLDAVDYSESIPKGTLVADYTVYYKAIGDKNHNDSDVYSLKVSIGKGKRDAVLAVVEAYTYRQEEPVPSPKLSAELKDSPKVSYYYNTTNSNVGGTAWSELTSKTLKAGTYYIYAVIEATDSYQEYVTEPNTFKVKKGEKVPVSDDSIDINMGKKGKLSEEITDKDGNVLKETIKDKDGNVIVQGDYEKIVEKVDKGDVIEYIITYKFTGDYKGKVTKKFSVPKEEKKGDDDDKNVSNITIVSKENAPSYSPAVESVPSSEVKSLVEKSLTENKEEISKQLEGTGYTVEAIKKQLESDKPRVTVDSNLVVEVKEEAQVDVASDEKKLVKETVKEIGAINDIGYLDISLYLTYSIADKKNNTIVKISREKITDTTARKLKKKFNIAVTILVPTEMRMKPDDVKRTYYVVRVHEGKADVLAKSTDVKITFNTDKFSTYALFYKDTKMTKTDDDNHNNNENTITTVNTTNSFAVPVENISNVVTLNGYNSPKTGDSYELFIWAGLLLVGIIMVLSARKTKNQ